VSTKQIFKNFLLTSKEKYPLQSHHKWNLFFKFFPPV